MGPDRPKVALTFEEPNHLPALVDSLVNAEYRVQILSPLKENAAYKGKPFSTNENHSDPSDIKVNLSGYSENFVRFTSRTVRHVPFKYIFIIFSSRARVLNQRTSPSMSLTRDTQRKVSASTMQ